MNKRCPRPLQLPIDENTVRALRCGDSLSLSGRLLTARDGVHKYLYDGHSAPCQMAGSVIYHCGPIAVREGNGWRVTAAGPTTSIREETYMSTLIRRFELRGIIGKGGMGQQTLAACRDCGCVYMHAVGGAAQVFAEAIRRVCNVYLADRFGLPEAIWELDVVDFPVVVTMDTHGGDLHDRVRAGAVLRLFDATKGSRANTNPAGP